MNGLRLDLISVPLTRAEGDRFRPYVTYRINYFTDILYPNLGISVLIFSVSVSEFVFASLSMAKFISMSIFMFMQHEDGHEHWTRTWT